jgi:serine/threonine-protein kinase
VTDPERWQRIEEILDQLLDLPADRRAARLAELAAGDPALAGEVRALLDEGARPGGVLDGSLDTLMEGVLGGEAAEAPVEGRVIGPYRVLRRLGRGGMGEVLLAERADGAFEHRVALKIVRGGPGREEIAERFRHERQILARLRHPNIASLYDGGATEDGAPYFAMEYVEGERITDHADRLRLGVDDRLRLFEAVCAAVTHAHRNLVIHRDLKPGNVMVTADGAVKLLDFGIAKLLDPEAGDAGATTHLYLTPAYASPEHVRGLPTSTATDVYSLGVVLYELLSGRHPHGDTARTPEVVRAILEEEPKDPSAVVTHDTRGATASQIAERRSTAPAELRRRLRGDLDNIVARALRKNPEERYGSVEDLRADLERYRRSLPVEARPATAGYRLRKFARRNRAAVLAGGVLLVALVGFAIAMSVLYARSQRNLARALAAEEAARLEAETARQVSTFMEGLFRTSHPEESTWEQVTARQILERAVERIGTQLGDQPRVRARLMGTLGDVYAGLGRYAEARRLMEAGIAIRDSIHDENDPSYAMALGTYAYLLQRVAEYPRALEVQRRAVAIGEATLGLEHKNVGLYLMNMGNIHWQMGALDSSLGYFERALTNHRAAFGPDHRATATVMHNLAGVHLARKDHAAARPLFEDAHRIWRDAYGEGHMRTLSALGGVAGAMDLGGDTRGALAIQQRVVRGLEQAAGPSNPEVGVALLGLAGLERKLGSRDDARVHAERARTLWEAAYGARHPHIAEALGMLADLRADAGDDAGALTLARRGLAMVDAMKLQNAETVALLERVGALERRLGNERGASASYERASAVATAVLGADHADVARLRALAAGP